MAKVDRPACIHQSQPANQRRAVATADDRRADLDPVSTYELGVRSPFVMHGYFFWIHTHRHRQLVTF
jgi:hypothetical protein